MIMFRRTECKLECYLVVPGGRLSALPLENKGISRNRCLGSRKIKTRRGRVALQERLEAKESLLLLDYFYIVGYLWIGCKLQLGLNLKDR